MNILTGIKRRVNFFGCFADPKSGEELKNYPNINFLGPLDEGEQIGEAYKRTKITVIVNNMINQNAVSPKLLECLASGGFALVDPRPVLFDFFGKEVEDIIYRNTNELNSKIDYYLSCDKEREEIVEFFREKIKDYVREKFEGRTLYESILLKMCEFANKIKNIKGKTTVSLINNLRLLDNKPDIIHYLGKDYTTMQFFRNLYQTRDMIETLKHYGLSSLENITLLEIGAADNLGCSVFMSMAGAEKVYSIDVNPFFLPNQERIENTARLAKLFKYLIADIMVRANNYSVKDFWNKLNEIFFVKNGKIKLNPNKIEFINCDASSIPLENNTIDLCFSIGTLEHIESPEKVIKEMRRILKIGGFAYHVIDLKDHRVWSDELLSHIEVPEKSWGILSGGLYTNRMIYTDWIKLFEKHNFEVSVTEKWKTDSSQYEKNELFNKYNKGDLDVCLFYLVARKVR